MVDRRSPGSMPHTAANPATGSGGEPPQQERNSSGYRFGLAVRWAVATVVDQWCPCPLVNRAPSQHRAKWEPNMGGIWEDRSAVNRGVPRRTARYGTGATCRFSVSGGRGRARAALGVKGSQVRILSSRPVRSPLTLAENPTSAGFLHLISRSFWGGTARSLGPFGDRRTLRNAVSESPAAAIEVASGCR